MSLIIHILCRSDRTITPRDIKGWFARTELLPDMTVKPDAKAFPEGGIEIRYKGAQRPITIYHEEAEGTRKLVEEVLEELEADPPVVKPPLRRRLLASVQTIDIDISPEHVDELIWTAIDAVEAEIANEYDGVIYVPGEGFYNRKLKRILSNER